MNERRGTRTEPWDIPTFRDEEDEEEPTEESEEDQLGLQDENQQNRLSWKPEQERMSYVKKVKMITEN